MCRDLASALAAVAALAACGAGNDDPCGDAERRLGFRACVHRVGDAELWASLGRATAPADQVRTARYLAPARDDARLPVLIEDMSSPYEYHYELMREAFGDRFPALSPEEYVALITDPERREFYAGSITEVVRPDGSHAYGFIAYDDATPAGTLTCAELRDAHDQVAAGFALGPVVVMPTTGYQRDVLATCDVPSYDPFTALEYEVYTRAIGYGTVRRYTPAELAAATAAAEYGFQDILVLDEAPLDIETVISGAVTGTRQGELSHLNVRSASRGTPNCYIRGAYDVLARWDGELVRLECGERGVAVEPATAGEAEAWWADLRPDPVTVPEPDLAWTELENLRAVPTATAADRAAGLRRCGAKGNNLAVLYQRIPAELQLDGFVVPFHYYDAFVRAHGFDADIDAMLSDAAFLSDGAVRRAHLDQLRAAIRAAPCDAGLLDALDAELRAVFGSDAVMVRFRSSSNAEDALHFNGAGLYESTSACLADDLDGDAAGPSRCDPDQPDERGLCRALTKVWSSLWLPRAYEERSWYGIDHRAVAMAILVDTRIANEQANIVAFTGNPLGPERADYLVNAQLGELDVVSSEPGVWPEKVLLTVTGGEVTAIQRARASTEVGDGEVVLDDDRLRELGRELWNVAAVYPLDADAPAGKRALLDTEWKIRPDGQLVIKQVRPFLDDAL